MKEARIESVTVSTEHFCAMCDDGARPGAGGAAVEAGRRGRVSTETTGGNMNNTTDTLGRRKETEGGIAA